MQYRFGVGCELDTARYTLHVGGEPRHVEPKVLDLLTLLVTNAGELITHDRLIDSLWGGRAISDSAVSAAVSAARKAVGDTGKRQGLIETVARRGFRFRGTIELAGENDAAQSPSAATAAQRVRFCRSADGTSIAYATTGAGLPIVRAGHWLTHLEHDRLSPVWRPFLEVIESEFSLTRYDQRGNGLSDWEAGDLALDRFVEDLEAVVDAAGLDRFMLYASSQGVPVSIAFARRHPQRVSGLVLQGGYLRGRLVRSAAERETGEAILALIRHGWGQPGSAFLTAFSSMFIPGGSKEQIDSLAELQRQTTSPENAASLRDAIDRFDVSADAAKLAVPTLVLHAREDGVQPLDEGRKVAGAIPGAEFVMLESRNHVVVPGDSAWPAVYAELCRFIAENADRTAGRTGR